MERQVKRAVIAAVEKQGIVIQHAKSNPLSLQLRTLNATDVDLLAIQEAIKTIYGVLVPVPRCVTINQLIGSIIFHLKHSR